MKTAFLLSCLLCGCCLSSAHSDSDSGSTSGTKGLETPIPTESFEQYNEDESLDAAMAGVTGSARLRVLLETYNSMDMPPLRGTSRAENIQSAVLAALGKEPGGVESTSGTLLLYHVLDSPDTLQFHRFALGVLDRASVAHRAEAIRRLRSFAFDAPVGGPGEFRGEFETALETLARGYPNEMREWIPELLATRKQERADTVVVDVCVTLLPPSEFLGVAETALQDPDLSQERKLRFLSAAAGLQEEGLLASAEDRGRMWEILLKGAESQDDRIKDHSTAILSFLHARLKSRGERPELSAESLAKLESFAAGPTSEPLPKAAEDILEEAE